MHQICRLCLQKITDLNFVILNNDPKSSQVTSQLLLCVPEMDLNVIKDPILCETCISTLHLASNFKKNCLRVEEQIRKYKQCMNLDGDSIDILDVYERIDDLHSEFSFMVTQKSKNVLFVELTPTTEHGNYQALGIEDEYKDSIIKLEDSMIKAEKVECDFVKDENDMLDEPQLNKTLEEHVSSQEINLENHVIEMNCRVLLTRLKETNFTRENRTASNQTESNPNTELYDPENLLLLRRIEANSIGDLNSTENLPHEHNIEANSIDKSEQTIKAPSTKYNKISNRKSPYTCNICKFKTADKKRFCIHKQTHHNKSTFNCEQCKFSTLYKRNLKNHMGLHDCAFCGTELTDINLSKQHKKNRFDQKIPSDRNTAKKTHLKGSISLSNERKPYTCNVCKRDYKVKGHLLNHQRIHNRELTCPMCSLTFLCKNVLLQHLKIHIIG